jgi:HSP20 family protein
MFDLIPFERRTRGLANYFDQMEKSFFGDFGGLLPEMRTDILDQGDHYLLQAELPGFSKEEIHLDIEGDQLMLRAEHNEESEKKEENFLRRERRYGSLSRSFDLSGIQADAIRASYRDGVLELELPKRTEPERQTRQIEIQ